MKITTLENVPILRYDRLGVESVNIQKNNKLGWLLQAQMSKISDLIRNDSFASVRQLQASKEVQEIVNLVKEYLNMKIKIHAFGPIAAVLPFYTNKNSILLKEYWRGNTPIPDQDKILKTLRSKTAKYDKATGKIGGLFAEYEHPIYFDFNYQVETFNLTPGEMTAILLHEIGHAVHCCEYADRFETTNQVMADVTEHILNKKHNTDLTYVYTELSKVDKTISQSEVEKMCSGNRIIAGAYWYKFIAKAVIGGVKSQMNDATYDRTSFEQLADSFAARFGYSAELVTALDKLHTKLGDPRKSTGILIMIELIYIASFVVGISSAVLLITGAGVPLHALICAVFAISLYNSAEHNKDYTYDELKDRYTRVRAECVNMLKDVYLDKEETKKLIDNIEEIDSIIRDTYRYVDIFSIVANFIVPGARSAISSISDQQIMEKLANNDLFVQAARLRAS